jgi:hypothetical protein
MAPVKLIRIPNAICTCTNACLGLHVTNCRHKPRAAFCEEIQEHFFQPLLSRRVIERPLNFCNLMHLIHERAIAHLAGSKQGAPPQLSMHTILTCCDKFEFELEMSATARHRAYGPIHRPGTNPYLCPAVHIEWIDKHAAGSSWKCDTTNPFTC